MGSEESMDEQFLKKMEEIVQKNLHDEFFGVEALSREVGYSRSQIHRKLRALTNQSISQFIRKIRLEKALSMLQQKSGTASEISYLVGFNSPTYFNKCFHDHYGYPPGKANLVKSADVSKKQSTS